jgi:diguanylate cyclase (GGDEF)-like protein
MDVMNTMDEVALSLLSAIPGAVGLVEPVLDGDNHIIDLSLMWANDQLCDLVGSVPSEGLKLSQSATAEKTVEWLRRLQATRGTERIDRHFWSVSPGRADAGDFYQLDLRWWDERLILVATPLVTAQPDLSTALRAAALLVKVLPELPVSYGVLLGERWLHFPTPSLMSSLGTSTNEFTALSLMDIVHEQDRSSAARWLTLPQQSRRGPFLFRSVRLGTSERWLELWMAQVEPGSSAFTSNESANIYVLTDVDDRVRLQEEHEVLLDWQANQLDVMYSALNASHDGIAIWKAVRDEVGEISTFTLIFVNEAGAVATGRMPRQLVRHDIEDVLGATEAVTLGRLLRAALDEKSVQIDVVDINSPQGWVGAYENTVVPFMHDQVLASFHDVSEERREQDRLQWLAEHDNLTGLTNRRGLDAQLEAALARTRLTNMFSGFVFIDIDDFKRVNDSYGHDQGDVLLKDFAARIQSSLDEGSLVARLAGDEFAILIETVESSADLQAKLDLVMEAIRRPFELPPHSLRITCSAGAALCSGQEQVTEVLRIADRAMYRAKHDGKNRFSIVHI